MLAGFVRYDLSDKKLRLSGRQLEFSFVARGYIASDSFHRKSWVFLLHFAFALLEVTSV